MANRYHRVVRACRTRPVSVCMCVTFAILAVVFGIAGWFLTSGALATAMGAVAVLLVRRRQKRLDLA